MQLLMCSCACEQVISSGDHTGNDDGQETKDLKVKPLSFMKNYQIKRDLFGIRVWSRLQGGYGMLSRIGRE